MTDQEDAAPSGNVEIYLRVRPDPRPSPLVTLNQVRPSPGQRPLSDVVNETTTREARVTPPLTLLTFPSDAM